MCFSFFVGRPFAYQQIEASFVPGAGAGSGQRNIGNQNFFVARGLTLLAPWPQPAETGQEPTPSWIRSQVPTSPLGPTLPGRCVVRARGGRQKAFAIMITAPTTQAMASGRLTKASTFAKRLRPKRIR